VLRWIVCFQDNAPWACYDRGNGRKNS